MHVVTGQFVSQLVGATERFGASFDAHAFDADRRERRAPAADAVDRVRRRLLETLGDGDASIGSVALSLGTSARALRRGLGEAGASYERLVDDARRRLSMLCLTTGGRSVDEIAALLGFPDPRGFHWDFRRGTGAAYWRRADSTASH